jgi:hypothetical protein
MKSSRKKHKINKTRTNDNDNNSGKAKMAEGDDLKMLLKVGEKFVPPN